MLDPILGSFDLYRLMDSIASIRLFCCIIVDGNDSVVDPSRFSDPVNHGRSLDSQKDVPEPGNSSISKRNVESDEPEDFSPFYLRGKSKHHQQCFCLLLWAAPDLSKRKVSNSGNPSPN
jgi:hypothetical protein